LTVEAKQPAAAARTRSPRRYNVQSKQERMRAEILTAAAVLFVEAGYEQTTLADIARRLGLGKSAIYHYFSGKEELLTALKLQSMHVMEEAALQAEREGGSGLEKLQIFLRRYAVQITTDVGRCLVLIGNQHLPRVIRDELWERRRRREEHLRGLIEEGVRDGSIAPRAVRMMSFAIWGAFNAIPQWYRADGDLTPEQIADEIMALITDGIRPPPAA
jgi:AcrR family transcriptional regulator